MYCSYFRDLFTITELIGQLQIQTKGVFAERSENVLLNLNDT